MIKILHFIKEIYFLPSINIYNIIKKNSKHNINIRIITIVLIYTGLLVLNTINIPAMGFGF